MKDQFNTIADALFWLVEHRSDQPALGELARHMHLSEAHLQRTFREYAGVSPKQFLKFLTKEHALARLRGGYTVLDASLDCGLSGPGRLHDLMITTEAVTPGEVRRGGAGVDMHHGFGPTPFGPALLAWTDRGISFLGFCRERGKDEAVAELREQWPKATLSRDDAESRQRLQRIFSSEPSGRLNVWLRGSPFQLKVWEALLSIPPGVHCSYGQLAAHIGRPGAGRAVGSAVGRNPVAWLIPCHRVITSIGTPGGYRWGLNTKQAMMGLEAARGGAVASAA